MLYTLIIGPSPIITIMEAMMATTRQVNIRMQEATWRRLRILSVTERKSMGTVIEEMLEERLAQIEAKLEGKK